MSIDRASGSFEITRVAGGNQAVLYDVTGATHEYTPGCTVSIPLAIRPALTEDWHALGWSMVLRAAIVLPPPPPLETWARFGKLWGGMFIDSGTVFDQNAPAFPSDLSTFTVLWDGDAPLKVLTGPVSSRPIDDFALIPLTYMFPQPIPIRSGSQTQMGLIMTPTLQAGTVAVVVRAASYSLIYDNGR